MLATNNYPKLHNALWPGLVGKGTAGAEPCIPLDTMLDLTARAEVNGVRFDGVDVFLGDPHLNVEAGDRELERFATKLERRNLVAGSLVAPMWAATGGGSAMGSAEECSRFVGQVRKACLVAGRL